MTTEHTQEAGEKASPRPQPKETYYALDFSDNQRLVMTKLNASELACVYKRQTTSNNTRWDIDNIDNLRTLLDPKADNGRECYFRLSTLAKWAYGRFPVDELVKSFPLFHRESLDLITNAAYDLKLSKTPAQEISLPPINGKKPKRHNHLKLVPPRIPSPKG